MLLQEVDGLTFCPGLDGSRIRHLPRTEDYRPRSLSYIDSSQAPSRERLVIVTECRRLANPPEETDGLFEPCAECVAARAGLTIPAGYTLAQEVADFEARPVLSVVSAS